MVSDVGEIDLGDAGSWIAVFAVAAWAILLLVLVAVVAKAPAWITFDVIEQQRHMQGVKDTVRNIWTNIALVGALLLTIAAPLVVDEQVGELADVAPVWCSTYVTFASISFFQYAHGTVECVVHLVYTEALDSPGVMRYLIKSHGAIGGPVALCGMATLHLCSALAIWVLLFFGLPCACAVFGNLIMLVGIIVVMGFYPASAFSPFRDNPGAAGWLWAERGEQPSIWLDRRLLLTAANIKVMHEQAKAAKQYEEQCALPEPHVPAKAAKQYEEQCALPESNAAAEEEEL